MSLEPKSPLDWIRDSTWFEHADSDACVIAYAIGILADEIQSLRKSLDATLQEIAGR